MNKKLLVGAFVASMSAFVATVCMQLPQAANVYISNIAKTATHVQVTFIFGNGTESTFVLPRGKQKRFKTTFKAFVVKEQMPQNTTLKKIKLLYSLPGGIQHAAELDVSFDTNIDGLHIFVKDRGKLWIHYQGTINQYEADPVPKTNDDNK